MALRIDVSVANPLETNAYVQISGQHGYNNLSRKECLKCKSFAENAPRNTRAKVTRYVNSSYLSTLLFKPPLFDFTACVTARCVLTFTLPTL